MKETENEICNCHCMLHLFLLLSCVCLSMAGGKPSMYTGSIRPFYYVSISEQQRHNRDLISALLGRPQNTQAHIHFCSFNAVYCCYIERRKVGVCVLKGNQVKEIKSLLCSCSFEMLTKYNRHWRVQYMQSHFSLPNWILYWCKITASPTLPLSLSLCH